MKHQHRLSSATALLLCILAMPGGAATVTIDMDSTGQTIDGFGGFGAMRPWFGGSSTFWTDSWLNTVVDDIGMTMFRTEFYPLPDQQHDWNEQPPYWRALKAKADASGEPLRVIATVWTPPRQYKHRIEAGKDPYKYGYFNPEYYDEYADYLIDYIKKFRNECGFDLYAISPGNEVQVYHGWFNSCAWEPEHLGEFCVRLARRLREEGLSTRIYYGDDLYGAMHFMYAVKVDNRIYQDNADTRNIVRACAMHYGDHGTDSTVFRSYGALSRMRGRVAWNTEFGNGPNTWDDAFGKAVDIAWMLRHNYGAIVYWIIGPHPNSAQLEESLMPSDRMGPKAYTAKAFFRFIRPGAFYTHSTSSSARLVPVVFRDPGRGKITIVLVNRSSSAQSVTLTGAELPAQLDLYRTGSGKNCVKEGTVSSDGAIQVAAHQIVTLEGEDVAVGVAPPRTRSMPVTSRGAVNEGFVDLRGRSLAPMSRHTGIAVLPQISRGRDTRARVTVRLP
ncbi:MAG: hypothetical protein GF331_07785 [Chitinivibrionales bacterium]|nr:hypothetical protein [Chitinivibrionales bacterium]